MRLAQEWNPKLELLPFGELAATEETA
jgi:hypothetical protein